ncbi:MAG: alpha-galactosidase [Sinobacteraceae bacterium]|nr:alpha-galactosidase [Nevskiaceae bacterium]
MKKPRTTRRHFLQLAGAGLASGGLSCTVARAGTRAAAGTAAGDSRASAKLDDGFIRLEFDDQMRLRVWQLPATAPTDAQPLVPWTTADYLTCGNGERAEHFALQVQSSSAVATPLGHGQRLLLRGVSSQQLEKSIEVDLLDAYPGFAFYRVRYRNLGARTVSLRRWTNVQLHLPRLQANGKSPDPPFWSFCGSTHADRRDWVQRVNTGFSQDNFMGMSASDYGGGTPIVDLWQPTGGVGVGHLEMVPQLLSLPVRCDESGATLSMTAPLRRKLKPGDTFNTPESFIASHSGDYFSVLERYRRIMSARGLSSPVAPESAYEPIWCAWGYERSCTVQLIEDTLPKVQDLGLRWAVIDDGWQSNVGDWQLDHAKYPAGDADMKRLVKTIKSRKLRARLWWAPLAVAPGTDLLHDHPDMLLLDRNGATQPISWWNCFYLCPAYAPTVEYMLSLVRRFMGEWDFDGLKIDGQHLNAVAPCYNPAHQHVRPEESVEKLQDFFLAVYRAATQLKPQAVVELCPCGTSYSFFNFRSFNQAPASDPESSWQVRHKGKTLKALMGPNAAFAGDHVELSAAGRDFASTVGIGGIVSTKFTWPRDPKPKDSFLLTPAKEDLWRKWIALYNERQLPRGNYRGELYDIGFDKPETHVVEKAGTFYYAFYAAQFSGAVSLRGLSAPRYRVRDYFNNRELGEVSPARNHLTISYQDFLVLEAVPV